MKSFFLLAFLVCTGQILVAQYVYTIKADSVKITNSCDTAELIQSPGHPAHEHQCAEPGHTIRYQHALAWDRNRC